MEYRNNGVKGIPKYKLLLFGFYFCVFLAQPEGDAVGSVLTCGLSVVTKTSKRLWKLGADMSYVFFFFFFRVRRITPTGAAGTEPHEGHLNRMRTHVAVFQTTEGSPKHVAWITYCSKCVDASGPTQEGSEDVVWGLEV